MILRKTIPFLLLMAVVAGCKKSHDAVPENPAISPEECSQQANANSGKPIQGKYIVSYKSSALAGRGISARQLKDLGSQVLAKHSIRTAALEEGFAVGPGGFIASLSADEADRLARDETIATIEPDRIVSLGTCFTVAAPGLVTWNIERVGYGDGIGKRAWIIDSGIDFEHPDLTVDRELSKSFLQGVNSANDENGHGTHVAGIIGAKNNNFGVLGVASGATLVSLRVLDKDGNGVLSSIIRALSYVNEHAAAGDVVNLSVGNDEGVSATLDQMVTSTAAKGIFVATLLYAITSVLFKFFA